MDGLEIDSLQLRILMFHRTGHLDRPQGYGAGNAFQPDRVAREDNAAAQRGKRIGEVFVSDARVRQHGIADHLGRLPGSCGPDVEHHRARYADLGIQAIQEAEIEPAGEMQVERGRIPERDDPVLLDRQTAPLPHQARFLHDQFLTGGGEPDLSVIAKLIAVDLETRAIQVAAEFEPGNSPQKGLPSAGCRAVPC